MINIRPIRANEIQTAKHVIFEVAYGIFGWDGTLEESIQHFESSDEFSDMDNFQAEYFDRGGLFLVVLDDETVIGSGAIRRMDEDTAELKRVWLLEAYHGQGLGFRVVQQLLEFASQKGCARVRLQTHPLQERAIDFYRKIGFHEIPCYNDDPGEVSMEISIPGTNAETRSSPAQ
jgi:putative acetyltransferase